jgi:hypothetical protein
MTETHNRRLVGHRLARNGLNGYLFSNLSGNTLVKEREERPRCSTPYSLLPYFLENHPAR